ncbi:MAG: MMPL family transporter [Acidimicrobiales bacterium]
MTRGWRGALVPASAVLVVAGLVIAGGLFGGTFSDGGFRVPGSSSTRADAILASRLASPSSTSLVVVYRSAYPVAASSRAQAEVAASLARLRRDPAVARVETYGTSHDPSLLSHYRHATAALVLLRTSSLSTAAGMVPALQAELRPAPGFAVQVTGAPAIRSVYNSVTKADLARAEAVSLPLALIVLLVAYESVVAALVPMVVAGLAIESASGAVELLARPVTMSIFATNVVTMIGLALAIDYSLFIVTRFREELRAGRSVDDAVSVAMRTVGRAVTVSAMAVAIGLGSLGVFAAPAVSSMGLAGFVVTVSTIACTRMVLPGTLRLIGPRIDALRMPLRRRHEQPRPGMWPKLARGVMAHPYRTAVPLVAVLLALGAPFASLRLSTGGALADIPPSQARSGLADLLAHFPDGGGNNTITAVVVPAAARGPFLSGPGQLRKAAAAGLASYTAGIARIPGVTGVQSVLSPPPGTSAAAYHSALAAPAAARPAAAASYFQHLAAPRALAVNVYTSLNGGGHAARVLAASIGAVRPPGGTKVLLTGQAPISAEFLSSFRADVPVSVGIVMAVTLLVLLGAFGSAVVPVKAVLTSIVSLAASLGALVWIFQDGHLSGLLGFTAPHSVVAVDPILIFAVVFGLSMDYEVILLSRVKEHFDATGDARGAVVAGLGSTGRIITSAALIMVTVFAAFGLAHSVETKALGIGMAIAVALDATVVRAVLVPAVLGVLGKWAWWSPGFLQRASARLALSERTEGGAGRDPLGLPAGELRGAEAPVGDAR